MQELLISGISELATPRGNDLRRGAEQGEIERLADVEVYCRDGRIAFVGKPEERAREVGEVTSAQRVDARGGTLIPGLVDCHTHLPWGGTRENELSQRLAGKTYLEIAAAGGGILSTVRHTRAASEDELTRLTLERLDVLLAHGTTTAEVKSGYGLSLDDELKQLRAIRAAAEKHPIEIVPTLLAAHEFPPEHRENRGAWVDEIVEKIIPAASEAGLAHFCDVFCEQGVFDVDSSRRVLQAGREHGLTPRLHADEFVDSGGAELAAELGAASADHLVAVTEAGIRAMAETGVLAVLLPGVSFFLMKDDFAPARRLIEAGVPVALATDCNPGSSHTLSLPFIVQLGIFQMRMTVEECLTAVTLNPACCLGLGGEVGSIEIGKRADFVILDGPNLLHLAYRMGVNPARTVIRDGRIVHTTDG